MRRLPASNLWLAIPVSSSIHRSSNPMSIPQPKALQFLHFSLFLLPVPTNSSSPLRSKPSTISPKSYPFSFLLYPFFIHIQQSAFSVFSILRSFLLPFSPTFSVPISRFHSSTLSLQLHSSRFLITFHSSYIPSILFLFPIPPSSSPIRSQNPLHLPSIFLPNPTSKSSSPIFLPNFPPRFSSPVLLRNPPLSSPIERNQSETPTHKTTIV